MKLRSCYEILNKKSNTISFPSSSVLKNRIVIMIQFVHLTDKWDTKCSNIYQAFLSTKRLLNNGQSRKRCQQKNMHPRKQYDFHNFIPKRSIFRIYSSIFNQQSVFRFKCKLSFRACLRFIKLYARIRNCEFVFVFKNCVSKLSYFFNIISVLKFFFFTLVKLFLPFIISIFVH